MSGQSAAAHDNQALLHTVAQAASDNDLGQHQKVFAATKGASRLDLYQNGFVAVVQGQVRVVRYDGTTLTQKVTRHTRNGRYTGTTYEYKATDVGGAQVVVTGAIAGADEWGPAIQEAVARAQFPLALGQLQAGQRLQFDKLWLSNEGVGHGAKTIPWEQMRAYRVRSGSTYLEAGDNTRIITPVASIPNFLLFDALLRRLRPELPETAGGAFGRRIAVRTLGRLCAVAAIVVFVILCFTSWPVHKDELCTKLAALQSSSTEITTPLKNLRKAAANYRGDNQVGVRADAKSLGNYDSPGFHWLKDEQLDSATPSIRAVCDARSFTTHGN